MDRTLLYSTRRESKTRGDANVIDDALPKTSRPRKPYRELAQLAKYPKIEELPPRASKQAALVKPTTPSFRRRPRTPQSPEKSPSSTPPITVPPSRRTTSSAAQTKLSDDFSRNTRQQMTPAKSNLMPYEEEPDEVFTLGLPNFPTLGDHVAVVSYINLIDVDDDASAACDNNIANVAVIVRPDPFPASGGILKKSKDDNSMKSDWKSKKSDLEAKKKVVSFSTVSIGYAAHEPTPNMIKMETINHAERKRSTVQLEIALVDLAVKKARYRELLRQKNSFLIRNNTARASDLKRTVYEQDADTTRDRDGVYADAQRHPTKFAPLDNSSPSMDTDCNATTHPRRQRGLRADIDLPIENSQQRRRPMTSHQPAEHSYSANSSISRSENDISMNNRSMDALQAGEEAMEVDAAISLVRTTPKKTRTGRSTGISHQEHTGNAATSTDLSWTAKEEDELEHAKKAVEFEFSYMPSHRCTKFSLERTGDDVAHLVIRYGGYRYGTTTEEVRNRVYDPGRFLDEHFRFQPRPLRDATQRWHVLIPERLKDGTFVLQAEAEKHFKSLHACIPGPHWSYDSLRMGLYRRARRIYHLRKTQGLEVTDWKSKYVPFALRVTEEEYSRIFHLSSQGDMTTNIIRRGNNNSDSNSSSSSSNSRNDIPIDESDIENAFALDWKVIGLDGSMIEWLRNESSVHQDGDSESADPNDWSVQPIPCSGLPHPEFEGLFSERYNKWTKPQKDVGRTHSHHHPPPQHHASKKTTRGDEETEWMVAEWEPISMTRGIVENDDGVSVKKRSALQNQNQPPALAHLLKQHHRETFLGPPPKKKLAKSRLDEEQEEQKQQQAEGAVAVEDNSNNTNSGNNAEFSSSSNTPSKHIPLESRMRRLLSSVSRTQSRLEELYHFLQLLSATFAFSHHNLERLLSSALNNQPSRSSGGTAIWAHAANLNNYTARGEEAEAAGEASVGGRGRRRGGGLGVGDIPPMKESLSHDSRTEQLVGDGDTSSSPKYYPRMSKKTPNDTSDHVCDISSDQVDHHASPFLMDDDHLRGTKTHLRDPASLATPKRGTRGIKPTQVPTSAHLVRSPSMDSTQPLLLTPHFMRIQQLGIATPTQQLPHQHQQYQQNQQIHHRQYQQNQQPHHQQHHHHQQQTTAESSPTQPIRSTGSQFNPSQPSSPTQHWVNSSIQMGNLNHHPGNWEEDIQAEIFLQAMSKKMQSQTLHCHLLHYSVHALRADLVKLLQIKSTTAADATSSTQVAASQSPSHLAPEPPLPPPPPPPIIWDAHSSFVDQLTSIESQLAQNTLRLDALKEILTETLQVWKSASEKLEKVLHDMT